MPYYSSNKNAWPTKNLPNMIGGGPSRPFQGIKITQTKPPTWAQIGPTRTKLVEKMWNDADAAQLQKKIAQKLRVKIKKLN